MEKLIKQILKTRLVSQEDYDKLREFVNEGENHKKYFISTEPKTDRIGEYYVFSVKPYNSDKFDQFKIYLKQTDNDLVVYRMRYYNIINDEDNDTKQAMLLYTLQKGIEFADWQNKSEASKEELNKLLEKVKKARNYYMLRMFLSDNRSKKRKKTVKTKKNK